MERPTVIVAAALSPSVDVAYDVERLVLHGVTRPLSAVRVPGGKALNAARVAHALGARVHAVAPLGGPTGAWIAEQLAAEGLATTVVPAAGVTRTCIAISARDDDQGASTDLYESPTALEQAEWEAVRRAVRELSGPGTWLLVSGSIPPGVPLPELTRLLHDARRAGTRVAVDASGNGLRAIAASAHLVKVNLAEASELLDARFSDAAQAAEAVRVEFGVDAVVTDGVRGACAATARGAHRIAPPSRTGRYPAGSGDAFLGGLLAALDRGDEWVPALDVAADAALRNALVLGQGRLASSS